MKTELINRCRAGEYPVVNNFAGTVFGVIGITGDFELLTGCSPGEIGG
jgi:hypothetical protein